MPGNRASVLDCGGKRSATPLWQERTGLLDALRQSKAPSPLHSAGAIQNTGCLPTTHESRMASWSAPALWRFLIAPQLMALSFKPGLSSRHWEIIPVFKILKTLPKSLFLQIFYSRFVSFRSFNNQQYSFFGEVFKNTREAIFSSRCIWPGRDINAPQVNFGNINKGRRHRVSINPHLILSFQIFSHLFKPRTDLVTSALEMGWISSQMKGIRFLRNSIEPTPPTFGIRIPKNVWL